MSTDDPNANRPGYKETKVGWIPEDWEAHQASSLTDRITVGVVIQPTNYYAETGIRAFRSANVREGHVNDQKWVYFDPAAHRELRKSAVHEGDLLIVRSGVGAGTCCVVPAEFDDSNCIDLVIVSPDSSKLDSNFLCNFVNSNAGRGHVFAKQNGLAQKHFNIGDCQNMWCVVPALPEQKKIAEILATCDEAIEKTKALIAAKQRQKSALMQQLLTGRKRLPGFAGVWKKARLGELFSERIETNREDLTLLAITGTRGIIPASEIDRKDSSSADKSRYKVIQPGDIGYNTMRMWQGVSAVSGLQGIVSPAYTICVPNDSVDIRFMGYFFKFPPVVYLFWRYSQGLVDDTLNLKFPNFAAIHVTVPDLAEQKAIARVLQGADEEIAALDRKKTILQQQKKALMQKLLTGQVRVKV